MASSQCYLQFPPQQLKWEKNGESPSAPCTTGGEGESRTDKVGFSPEPTRMNETLSFDLFHCIKCYLFSLEKYAGRKLSFGGVRRRRRGPRRCGARPPNPGWKSGGAPTCYRRRRRASAGRGDCCCFQNGGGTTATTSASRLSRESFAPVTVCVQCVHNSWAEDEVEGGGGGLFEIGKQAGLAHAPLSRPCHDDALLPRSYD